MEWRGSSFSAAFLHTEWERVVDGWQLDTWEDYRSIRRAGRHRRLSETQRETLWPVFEWVKSGLQREGLTTRAELFGRLTAALGETGERPFDHVVVDEAQDVSVPQLRFLGVLAGGRENGLFFAGDPGQRIFQQPSRGESWASTSAAARRRCASTTGRRIRSRCRQTACWIQRSPMPTVKMLDDEEGETRAVAEWLKQALSDGLQPGEVGVFVRSGDQMDRAKAVAVYAGLPAAILDETGEAIDGCVTVGTMHLAKGLEFRAVAVMACDAEVIPLQSRVEEITDEADLDEVYNTERNLLYVACTRARDRLLVSGVKPASEFLDDLRG